MSIPVRPHHLATSGYVLIELDSFPSTCRRWFPEKYGRFAYWRVRPAAASDTKSAAQHYLLFRLKEIDTLIATMASSSVIELWLCSSASVQLTGLTIDASSNDRQSHRNVFSTKFDLLQSFCAWLERKLVHCRYPGRSGETSFNIANQSQMRFTDVGGRANRCYLVLWSIGLPT